MVDGDIVDNSLGDGRLSSAALQIDREAARRDAMLWLLQRMSAMVLAFAVAVHLATMIFAVRQGLTAADILNRTRGSVIWAAFYSIFVLAVAVHVPIGFRNILAEWARLRGLLIDALLVGFAVFLLVMGGSAVWAVCAPVIHP